MKDAYHIFGSIFFIAQNWQTLADKEIIPRAGITTKQWMLLIILGNAFKDHIPTLTEAAEAFGASRQNVKRIALELEKKGFLMILKDRNDQRIHRLVLTGKHKTHFEGTANLKWQEEFVGQFFKNFSMEELQNMRAYAEKLIYNIEDI